MAAFASTPRLPTTQMQVAHSFISCLLGGLSGDKNKNHQLCAPLGLLACIPWTSQPRLYSRLTHSFPTLTGLTSALEFLKAVADKYDKVGYADLFQLASATGIEASFVICCDYTNAQSFVLKGLWHAACRRP